jgi:HEPN domain-containing protein
MKKEEKRNYEIRLKDALDFLESAGESLERGRYKVTVMNAGDAGIAANDAFTIFLLEQKASSDHREAYKLHKLAGQKINSNKIDSLKFLIEHRHKDGYRSVVVSKKTAEKVFREAIKFVKWVQEII